MFDYNVEVTMFDFCQVCNMSNLVRGYTCHKNPSCTDLVLTNKPKSFLISAVIETGSSDFYNIKIIRLLL